MPKPWVETSVALDLTSRRRRAVVAELVSNGAAGKAALAAERRHFGDLPLAVISRSITPSDSYGGTDPVFLRRWAKLWMPLQRDLATLSSNSRHIITDRSGHYPHIDEPDVVATAIQHVCEQVADTTAR